VDEDSPNPFVVCLVRGGPLGLVSRTPPATRFAEHAQFMGALVLRCLAEAFGMIECPHCGSSKTVRDPGRWELLWLIAAAASFFIRLLTAFALHGEYRGEPGTYFCRACGCSFTFYV
jgi:hypothetical protein